MSDAARAVDICICTYRRPHLLHCLLQSLIAAAQQSNSVTCTIIVADNDINESARGVVDSLRAASTSHLQYCVEPLRNIARARNLAVSSGHSPFVAFIDDDELPAAHWLELLIAALEQERVDGVLGPVLPDYPKETPEWFRRAGLYDFRKRHKTGERLSWRSCRTGNVLLRRSVITALQPPFREEFGTGGEDQDFFRRAADIGKTFAWCDEAVVYEKIQPSRWNRRAIVSRALLRGKNTYQHPGQRWRHISKALVAIPLYTLALPLACVAGHHRVMRLLPKLASHVGLILASVGLNPLRERAM